jgi:membrane-bound serine protease (ClpP class)
MRSIMRATAESHGMDTLIVDGDTTYKYRRDPRIAEAMVDDRIMIPGIIDSGRIVAFTASEALKHGYCEAEVGSISGIVKYLHESKSIPEQEVRFTEVKKTGLDKIVGFLAKPGLQGALLMIIFWGIFFEIRTPGIGFPLAAAVLAALLYFAPLYLDGLAANWEILLFIIGIVLIALEIFVIPGFGVAGVTGILFTVGSLILSLVRNVDFDFSQAPQGQIGNAALIVLFSLIGFIVGAFLFGRGMTSSPLFKKMVLSDTLKDAKAGIHTNARAADDLMGHKGVAHTDIRPIGKAKIDDVIMDVKSMGVFISKGSAIQVVSRELGYWVVEKV